MYIVRPPPCITYSPALLIHGQSTLEAPFLTGLPQHQNRSVSRPKPTLARHARNSFAPALGCWLTMPLLQLCLAVLLLLQCTPHCTNDVHSYAKSKLLGFHTCSTAAAALLQLLQQAAKGVLPAVCNVQEAVLVLVVFIHG